MSELGYLLWFIATALMIIIVLTVSTLAAAGILGRPTEAPAAHRLVPRAEHAATEDQHEQRAA